MEGNYETAIIDKTSTQQKLEHGQSIRDQEPTE